MGDLDVGKITVVISRCVTAIGVMFFFHTCAAQEPDNIFRAREIIRSEIDEGNSPGLQYLILTRNSLLFSSYSGSSDLRDSIPMDSATTMMVYSVTKAFTAAAVLQLVENGSVGIDSAVSQYLLEFPYGDRITVRHLLSQMSGLPNPLPLRWIHSVDDHAKFDERAALASIAAGNSDLSFEPGEKSGYSNISYWYLGALIEKVSGMTFEEYLRKNIFQRLQLSDREIGFVIPEKKKHSKGYLAKWSWFNLIKSFVVDGQFIGEYEGSWLHVREHYVHGPAFGGIISTAAALGSFLKDQLSDSSVLFSPATQQLFYQQQRTNNGTPVRMTPGWHIGEKNGRRYFFKEGGGGGFHAEMRIYRDEGIASVVLSNNTSFDVKGFLNSIDILFMNDDDHTNKKKE